MTKNAKARRTLGLDHWQSNTQKVALLDPHYHRRKSLYSEWRVLRTKSSNVCYWSLR